MKAEVFFSDLWEIYSVLKSGEWFRWNPRKGIIFDRKSGRGKESGDVVG